ncbi:MAG: FAD-dependent oxidoreductase [Alteraurantiacibacter sp. bin_em_oilr2.035]|nr:FAD-dependent oxidoreductase [Alteraurantiacibacter sp. bin_em_oilr2.035]
MPEQYDIAIIGAGMAGASLAAEIGLAANRGPSKSIIVLEAEDSPGYHATGRSAAFWEECYGGPDIAPLTIASGLWLREHGFLQERGALYLGREDDEQVLQDFLRRFAKSDVDLTRIDRDRLEGFVPGIRPAWDRAIYQPRCADIDVAGVHQHYLAQARKAGAHIACRARLLEACVGDRGWTLCLSDGRQVHAHTIVNAAGAWADEVAQMAGARALGIQPYRRTVAQLRTDPALHDTVPLCLDISGNFYFRPDSGKLWLSPHDEVASPPCDAAPEEMDVALAIDRLEGVVDWRVEAVERKWAGLRSFAPDRKPVYGFDPRVPHFFWFAGQGGYGIQTAPAAARLGAQLLLDLPRNTMTKGLNVELYMPDRFAAAMA